MMGMMVREEREGCLIIVIKDVDGVEINQSFNSE
jgi:hypothetical protein